MKGIRRILIINGKGGCGKTTIATNLAIAYAQQGYKTALLDYDSQASSTDWSELREQTTKQASAGQVSLQVIPTHKKVAMYQTRAFSQQLAEGTERIIIDTPSGARERDIDTLIKQCDVVLVPMLPSPLDIRSGSRFVAELLTHRAFRANPRPIGVIANRLQAQNNADPASNARIATNEQKLLHALECLDVPCVAHFSDSILYTRAAEEGRGITELSLPDSALDRAEQARWPQLVNWVEAQPKRTQRSAQPARAVPAQATDNNGVNTTDTHPTAGRQDEQADGALA